MNTAATVGALALPGTHAAEKPGGVRWPIGGFNRPWAKWGYEAALDGIKAAGYTLTGLLTRRPNEPLIGADATPEYLDQLKKKIAARGLKANMGTVRVRYDVSVEESIREVRQQIANAHALALEFALTFGVDKPEHYDDYYRIMRDAAAYAQERGIKLVLKPHGGGSGAAEEILRCMAEVKHPNFKVWYDAGNIIYYTGKDPVEQLKPIARHVTGFCAKDCSAQKGEVMIQFGTGRVDFRAVFGELKKAGFDGPVMVESCALSDKPAEVTANARANREFLENLLARL